MGVRVDVNEIVTPSVADSALAKESGIRLAALLANADKLHVEVKNSSVSTELVLPPSALRMLLRLLTEMGRGNALTLMPIHAELTTQQAANMLSVSRPHLVKLLDNGAIPSRKIGSHRRIPLAALLDYKQTFLQQRHATLDELQTLSEELDMGY